MTRRRFVPFHPYEGDRIKALSPTSFYNGAISNQKDLTLEGISVNYYEIDAIQVINETE